MRKKNFEKKTAMKYESLTSLPRFKIYISSSTAQKVYNFQRSFEKSYSIVPKSTYVGEIIKKVRNRKK